MNSLRASFRRNRRTEFIEALHSHFLQKDIRSASRVSGDTFANVDKDVNEQILALLTRCKAQGSMDSCSVSVRASSLGGLGVFATTALHRGSVVALYPGEVHSPADLRNAGGSAGLDPTFTNEYVMFSNTGMLFNGGIQPESTRVTEWTDACPAAVGQRINHPALESGPPNVVCWPTVLTVDQAEDLRSVIPNTRARDGRAARQCRHLLGIVCTDDISEGTELLLDYRLEAGMNETEVAELPSWYHPVPDPDRPVYAYDGPWFRWPF